MAGRQVDDAVVEGGGAGMMGEVVKERGLANAGFAAYLNGEAGFEGRQRCGKFRLAADECSDDARPQEDRRRPRASTRPCFLRRFTESGAERFANLQKVTAGDNVPFNRAVSRSLRLRTRIAGAGNRVGLRPVFEGQLLASLSSIGSIIRLRCARQRRTGASND